MSSSTTENYAEEHALFTEAEYARLLDLAREKYTFCKFGEFSDKPIVVWRHDVDHSAHRALAVARLEAKRGLSCVYHALLTSRYYNIFEPEIVAIFREIAALGHEVGLHFDMDAFGEVSAATVEQIEKRARLEREVIENVVGITLGSMSFHNYLVNQDRLHDLPTVGGLLNCSAAALTRKYKYVSDSNGIWRYERLRDVLEHAPYPRLHVLTHPEWWTKEPMPPVERLRRIVIGRADATWRLYAHQLSRDGRLVAIGKRIGFTDVEVKASGKRDA